MKYCTKCGAQMNDDALFCPKCGTKVEEVVVEEKITPQPVEEKQAPNEEAPKTNVKIKGQRVSIHEQPVKQFLPVPLALIACSIALWIINAVGNTSGFTRIFPLLSTSTTMIKPTIPCFIPNPPFLSAYFGK